MKNANGEGVGESSQEEGANGHAESMPIPFRHPCLRIWILVLITNPYRCLPNHYQLASRAIQDSGHGRLILPNTLFPTFAKVSSFLPRSKSRIFVNPLSSSLKHSNTPASTLSTRASTSMTSLSFRRCQI